jgi:hypothetical protein
MGLFQTRRLTTLQGLYRHQETTTRVKALACHAQRAQPQQAQCFQNSAIAQQLSPRGFFKDPADRILLGILELLHSSSLQLAKGLFFSCTSQSAEANAREREHLLPFSHEVFGKFDEGDRSHSYISTRTVRIAWHSRQYALTHL